MAAQYDAAITAGIDTTGVEQGAKAMDREMKAFAASAERELKKVESATAKAGKAAAKTTTAPGGKSGYIGGQIAMQMQDVGVQMQMGAKATQIIAQQGSQIASLFGPQGAIIGGIVAMGLALWDMASGTTAFEEKLERAAEKFSKLTAANKKVFGVEMSSKNEADILAARRENGAIAADRLKIERETEEKIRQIRNSFVTPGTKKAAIAEVNRLRDEQMKDLENASIRKDISDQRDKQQYNRTFSEGAPGDKQRFDLETKLAQVRETADARILDLREQGVDAEERIAEINVEAAKKIEELNGTKKNQMARLSAEQTLKSATRQAFVESASWEKESALLNLRGSADEKKWKVLQAEEKYLRTIAGMRDPTNDKEAAAFMKTQPTNSQLIAVQKQLVQNQAQQAQQFAAQTAGKTQAQLLKQIRTEDKAKAKADRDLRRQFERGGLLNPERDGAGNVIGGFDPVSRKHVSGDQAKQAIADNRKRINFKPDAIRGRLADATLAELVTAFGNEIQKIITR